jgi:hypothetical protein
MSTTYQQIREMVQRELARIGHAVRRGVLGGGIGADTTAKVQGAGGDDFEDIETWQHFGFASRPPVSGEVLVVLPFGRDEGAIICAETDRAHRPSIAANEVAVYGYKSGSVQSKTIHRANGDIDLVAGTSRFVRVGDSSGCEFLLLGETVKADLLVAFDLIKAITPGDAAANATALGVIKGAFATLSTDTSTWLTSIAKGK